MPHRSTPVTAPPPTRSDDDVALSHGLKQRHLSLIALGGVIGAGLFVGVLVLMAREPGTRVQLYYTGGMTAVLTAAGYAWQRRRAGG